VPRYHFNIYAGVVSIDSDGTELPHQRAAEQEAVKLAGETLKHTSDGFLRDGEWRMEVTDASGLALFNLHSPAGKPRSQVTPPSSTADGSPPPGATAHYLRVVGSEARP
jgi:hypothetical protein